MTNEEKELKLANVQKVIDKYVKQELEALNK
jgi:hypothetical protein